MLATAGAGGSAELYRCVAHMSEKSPSGGITIRLATQLHPHLIRTALAAV
jgi:hypothetical protein